VTTALMLAVYTLVDGNHAGWGSAQTLGLLGPSATLLALFLWSQARVPAPLLPLALLRLHNLAISNAVGVLWAASMFAWFFLSALYLQRVLDYSALQADLAFLPSNLLMAGCSLGASAWLVMRCGIRRTLGGGLLLAAAGLALFALAPVAGRWWRRRSAGWCCAPGRWAMCHRQPWRIGVSAAGTARQNTIIYIASCASWISARAVFHQIFSAKTGALAMDASPVVLRCAPQRSMHRPFAGRQVPI
jgi:hypothetical protein